MFTLKLEFHSYTLNTSFKFKFTGIYHFEPIFDVITLFSKTCNITVSQNNFSDKHFQWSMQCYLTCLLLGCLTSCCNADKSLKIELIGSSIELVDGIFHKNAQSVWRYKAFKNI